MNHVTSIGLDVHARSVTGTAFNPITGEVTTKKFGNSPAEIADRISSFESPKAVYGSGATGFRLFRKLDELGVDCMVSAVSKMHRPSSDKRNKNDSNDAAFLSRLLASNNIVEVAVPDEGCEAMRDLSHVLEDIRENLAHAKQRLGRFLMRHGHVFGEKNEAGRPVGYRTKVRWAWIRRIGFAQAADEDAFAFYISEVRHIEARKRQIEGRIRSYAKRDRWNARIEALRCLKGIETMTAFSLVVEANVFSRFATAAAFASWPGLVPSERSGGERSSTGGITKAGNAHLRKLLVESSWHCVNAHPSRKKTDHRGVVPLSVENHAAKGVKRLVERRRALHPRGKKPVVAN